MIESDLYPYDAVVECLVLPPGPWRDEPNKKAWVDSRTKLPCAMMRNRFGSWCGYVGVPAAHAGANKSRIDSIEVSAVFYSEWLTRTVLPGRDIGWIDIFLATMNFDNAMNEQPVVPLALILPAHGGLTFSDLGNGNLWWFGFDCCHFGDLSPLLPIGRSVSTSSVYRDQDYVYGCVTRLAWALAELDAVAVKIAVNDDAPTEN